MGQRIWVPDILCPWCFHMCLYVCKGTGICDNVHQTESVSRDLSSVVIFVSTMQLMLYIDTPSCIHVHVHLRSVFLFQLSVVPSIAVAPQKVASTGWVGMRQQNNTARLDKLQPLSFSITNTSKWLSRVCQVWAVWAAPQEWTKKP